LLKRLRQWSHQKADEESKPVYFILSKKATYEIANRLPQSRRELLKISGVGNAKIATYGEEILDIVKEYCGKVHIN
jgi:superfamily II DNA helicase RecQ